MSSPLPTLTRSTITLPTAVLGPDNPLPPLASDGDLHAGVAVGEGVDDEMRAGLGYGHVASIAPYLLQDAYGRDRSPVEHPVAVLENERLRATVLLGQGGRLWSLWDKAAHRELLYRNRVLQPGNLALRDAWFAGGVEWNLGTIGHTPLTCAPMHAARVDRPDGTPVLRLWEYERLRGLVYQLDLSLPPGASSLVVAVRVTNPQDHEVPMYWWSNIAVPQGDDVRVVTPADAAWRFAYGTDVSRVGMPHLGGVDRSYATRSDSAADYFFDLEDAPRPWVAALDGAGSGLVQSSTRELRGRKLFLWGTGAGGRHWQEWLSPEGGDYLEIQAGLARTQLEHVPMPGRTQWSWVETYGPLTADPVAVHGDWADARSAVAAALEVATPREWLEQQAVEAREVADLVPTRLLHRGSGWGALEQLRLSATGDAGLDLPGTPFGPDTLGPEQGPWLALLESGRVPDPDPSLPPVSVQTAAPWAALLEGATGWAGLLHLGTARWQAGDPNGAVDAWEASLGAAPSAWAWRNLAVARRAGGDTQGALAAYEEAAVLAPHLAPLLVERLRALVGEGRHEEVAVLVDGLDEALAGHPEVRYLDAVAAVRRGDVERAERTLHEDFALPGLREGARDLDELWWELAAARLAARDGVAVDDAVRARARTDVPLPWALDFRMGQPQTS